MINTKSKKQELILVCSNPKFRGNNANKSACKDYSRIRNSSQEQCKAKECRRQRTSHRRDFSLTTAIQLARQSKETI